MKPRPLLLSVTWLASLAGVYCLRVDRVKDAVEMKGAGQAAVDAPSAEAGRGGGQQISGQWREEEGRPGRIPRLMAAARKKMGANFLDSSLEQLRATALLAEVEDAQIREALAEVEKTVRDPAQKAAFYARLLGQWAEQDGPAAMDYLERHGRLTFDQRSNVRGAILTAWIARDADGVWQWLQTKHRRPSESSSDSLQVLVFSLMAEKDLNATLQRLGQVDKKQVRFLGETRSVSAMDDALKGIAQSATDGAACRQLMERAAAVPDRREGQLKSEVLEQWINCDAEGALGWLRTQLPEEQKIWRRMAAHQLKNAHFELAADFILESVTQNQEPNSFILEELADLAYFRRKPLVEWLDKQPARPELDELRVKLVQYFAPDEKDAAQKTANKVQDAELRRDALETVEQIQQNAEAAKRPIPR